MKVEILKAEKKDKSVLRHLLEFYCYDFSEYLGTDVNEHGRFDYQYVDSYWIETGRHPYFIKADGKYAGFVLVNKDFKIIGDPKGHCISEFFVLRRYRRQGIGMIAAKAVFNLHPGPWEISQVMLNDLAVTFWDHVVQSYTEGKFVREYLEKNGLKKQVLLFEN